MSPSPSGSESEERSRINRLYPYQREVAAAEAFLEASRQYIRVKGPRGWRTRRVVSLTPPDADDMTIGRNARSYLMGSPNPAPGRGKLDGLDQEDEAERGLVDNIP